MENDPILERILDRGRNVEPVFRPMQDENKLWFVEIPGEGSAGLQIFRGTDIKSLCTTLAQAQFHATNKIRQLMRIIKDQQGTEAELEAERRFAARQEQGLYDEF